MTKNQDIKVSIIMLSKNSERHLLAAASSALSQDIHELVLVEPGSTDHSRTMCELLKNLYPDKIQNVFKRDTSPAEGLNNALEIVSGKYVLVINADDYLNPGSIEYIKRFCFKNEKVDVLLAAGYLAFEDSSKTKFIAPIKPSRTKLALSNFGAFVIFHQGMVFNKAKYESLRFNPKNKVNWDFEFLLDLFVLNARFSTSNTPIATFRIHESAMSQQDDHQKLSESYHMKFMEQLIGRDAYFYEIWYARCVRVYKFLKSAYLLLTMQILRNRISKI